MAKKLKFYATTLYAKKGRILVFGRARIVAQVSNLLYRGFPIARAARRSYIVLFRRRGYNREIAGWKPATQQVGNLRYEISYAAMSKEAGGLMSLVKESMDDIEGEHVARQRKDNREWTQRGESWGARPSLSRRSGAETDCPATAQWRGLGLPGPRLATQPPRKKNPDLEVSGETPNTAVGPSPLRFDATKATALTTDRISNYWRLFASIRGSAPFLDISESPYASR